MTGAVYDRGYRPYEGERGGRTAARTALWRATIRRALGLRRPWRQKVAPFVLLAIVTVPAVVNVGVKYLTRNTPARDLDFITYRDYVGVSNALLVFVALTAPDIVCPDRRQRVLPLIFARPLRGVDYVAAKVGAMFAILFAFSFLPQVVLFVGQMLVSTDGALTYLRDNAEVLWQVPAAVSLLALFYAVIGVAIASLTTRRIIAGASIVGLFLITSITSAVLVGPDEEVHRGGGFGPPVTTEDGQVVTPEGPLELGEGAQPQETDTYFVVRTEPTAAPLLNVPALPLILRDVVFLGEVDPDGPMSGLDNGGLYAAGVYALWVGAGLLLLLRRYHEVER
ncbi:MAG: ABC transporter permease [Acidimicrobiia bacterium]